MLGNIKKRIFDTHGAKNPLGCLPENEGAWIIFLVDSVSEAHEATLALFRGLDSLAAIVSRAVDLLKHFNHCRISPAMQGPPEGTHPG